MPESAASGSIGEMRAFLTILLLGVLALAVGLPVLAPGEACADVCPLDHTSGECPPACTVCTAVSPAATSALPTPVAAPAVSVCGHCHCIDDLALPAVARDILHVPKA